MFGWQLRHDPSTQIPVLRLPSIREGRRIQTSRRKWSHSTTASESSADDERRKLLPERRKTLATSTIPKDLFLIAADAASSCSSLIVPGEGRQTLPVIVRRQHSLSPAGQGLAAAVILEEIVKMMFQAYLSQSLSPLSVSPRSRLGNPATPSWSPRKAVVPSNCTLHHIREIDDSRGSSTWRFILQEAAGASGDHLPRNNLDFTYADQCELEDLLEGTGTVPCSRRLSSALADATPFAITETKDPSGRGRLGSKDPTEAGATTQDFSDSKADEESSQEDESEGWRRQAKLVLPHVGLVLMTIAYTLIGAGVFYTIEQPYERHVKQRSLQAIFEQEERMLAEIFRLARYDHSVSEEDWRVITHDRLLNLTDILYDSFDKHFLTSKEIRDNNTIEIWSFSTAVFFAATVVTTIGYGTPVPVTFPGRLVCVFFALFGIPLTLLTIANVGKFFSEHLLWLYGCYLRLMQKVQKFNSRFRKNPRPMEKNYNKANQPPLVCDKCRRPSANGGRKTSLSDIDFSDIQEKTVPASIVLSILIGYTALGGFLFRNIENWTFFESFYFSFVTMTTIGFGDLVPRYCSIVLILLYIVLGLAITTMCIDLVGAHYVRKIHYFGRKIQDARSALAIVGGKVVYVGELYAQLMAKRYGLTREQMDLIPDAFIIENLYLTKHLIPFVPRDIRRIRYIDADSDSFCSSTSTLDDAYSCRYCHGRMSNVSTTHTTLLKQTASSRSNKV